MKVLVLGADRFIGRHIAFHLRAAGHEVVAQARRPARLAQMGFATLQTDLTNPRCHDPAFWAGPLQGAHLINAAGLLTGSDAAFQAVHVLAPKAALAALGPGARVLLISTVGIGADTPFARWRRETEALFAGRVILRPGLVLAETSYGGSSALRAFAARPLVTPVVGDDSQAFNPIHAEDLARIALAQRTAPPETCDVGGTEILTLANLTRLIRRWLGLADRPLLRLSVPLARAIRRIGDALRIGPISATAIDQLQAGVPATPAPRGAA